MRKEFAAFIESEIAKWGRAVKESGAKQIELTEGVRCEP